MSSPRTHTCFVKAGRPLTANKNKGPRGAKVGQELRRLFLEAGGTRSAEPLYGIVYYIVRGYQPSTDADADNISKPVWDALTGVAYDDDEIVRLRVAGVIETDGPSRTEARVPPDLDLTGVPIETVHALGGLLRAGERHILYIEVGPVRHSLFRFALAGGG